jgi:hypothetical protein
MCVWGGGVLSFIYWFHLNVLLTHTYLQVCQLCVRKYATCREEIQLISVFNREKDKEMKEGKG